MLFLHPKIKGKERRKMKKLICILAVLILSLSLISCDDGDVKEIDPGLGVDENGGITFPIVPYEPPK